MSAIQEREVLFHINGAPVVKVSCLRIRKEEQEEGLYYYNIRHSDKECGKPVTIEKYVLVNHYGTIVTTKPIEYLEVDNEMNHKFIELTNELIQLIFENET